MRGKPGENGRRCYVRGPGAWWSCPVSGRTWRSLAVHNPACLLPFAGAQEKKTFRAFHRTATLVLVPVLVTLGARKRNSGLVRTQVAV